MKYHILSHITRILLGRLRRYHRADDKLLVFSNDFIGEEVFAFGVYERKEIESLISALEFDSSQHTLLDIGANIGNHAVQFAKHFKKVICFEPNKLMFDVLLINTRLYENVLPYNVGLSNVNETAFLKIPKHNFGGASITADDDKNLISISLKRGDEFIQEDFSVIKIDVEGHEVEALKGLENLIKRNMPIICFELIHQTSEDLEIITLLKKFGYTQFYIPHRKSLFPFIRKESFTLSFVDGLLFKWKPQLIKIGRFDASFYNMIFCEHPDSFYKLKKDLVKK